MMRGIAFLISLVLATPAVAQMAVYGQNGHIQNLTVGCPPLQPGWTCAPATTTDTAAWNAAQPAPTGPTTIATNAFILRFTPAEFAAVKASTDAGVQQYLFAITTAQTVTLTDPVVTTGMAYLVAQNLLTQAAAANILSPNFTTPQ